MPIKYFLKMLCILVLCPALLVAVQTLTIDSQLGTSVEDCFERITIGEQLPVDAIYRNVSELTTRECETICKQDKQCQTYDYGVGAKGNATCNLSTVSEKDIKEKNVLRRHPDYDVYIRRFQCEQSPPSPIQSQFDEGEGPAHRPVFRPDEDEPKRPLDDYQTDIRPFETIRPELLKPIPPYRPQYNNYIDNDRPDDYNQKPVFDAPPSYGAHKPQNIPYKPMRPLDLPPSYGLHKPQEIPYRPMNQSYRPDPYDVLQFQEGYRPTRPLNPGYWRPDPYHPPLADEIPDIYGPKPTRPQRPNNLDPYGLEKPQYHYIVRPNRKPRPDDAGYGSKPDPYQGGNPERPLGYRPYDYPSKPNKPSYNYDSQYASNYGQSQYQDNSIYLEIFDPPRPYKPTKRPVNDRPSYGVSQDYRPGQNYGSNYGYGQGNYGYGSSSSYSQSQSQSSYQGTITEIGFDQNIDRPQDSGYSRPQKPAYRPEDSTRPQKPYAPQSGYGSSDSGYGSQTQKPTTQKPPYSSDQGSYGNNQGSYGSNQGTYSSNQASYGSSSHSDTSGSQSYGGSNRPSLGDNQDDNQGGYGGQRPHKPTTTPRPYGNDQGYGVNQPSYSGSQTNSGQGYGGNQASYGGYAEHHDSHYSSQHSQSFGSYGNNKPSSNRPSYEDRPGYGGNRPSYSDNQSGYGGNRPYGDDRPYSDNRPYDRPSYDRPMYGDRPYGDRPDDRPSYGDNKPSYGRPPYGDAKPPARPSYGDSKPSYERPSYGDNRPSYERPSYTDSKPYDRPSYGDNKPSYGDSKPSHEGNQPAYGGNQASYGGNQASYGGNRPQDNNRPDPAYESNSGYGSNSDSNSGYGGEDYKNSHRPTQKPAYGTSDRPNRTDDRPSIKPVYEYELDKPSNVPSYIVKPGGEVITSRPVTVGDYGREPAYPASYKAGTYKKPKMSYDFVPEKCNLLNYTEEQ